MKRLLLLAALALTGCGMQPVDQRQSEWASAKELVKSSNIVCADGNQVRFVVYALGGNASSFTSWNILNEDGTPKRCVKRIKDTPAQYEEVPQ